MAPELQIRAAGQLWGLCAGSCHGQAWGNAAPAESFHCSHLGCLVGRTEEFESVLYKLVKAEPAA